MPRLAALLLPAILCAAIPLHGDEKPMVAELQARAGNISATAISDDGKLVLTGEDDGLVTLWNVKGATPVYNTKKGHTRAVFAAALLPGGRRAVTAGDDNLVILWDLPTGNRLQALSTGDSTPLALACTRDGTLAAAGCDDGRILVWTLKEGRCIATLPHSPALCGMAFSPDGRLLAAGYSDGHVIAWDASTWKARFTLPDANAASVGALAFSPDGRFLATGDQNGAGFVWSAADGALVSRFAGYEHPEVPPAPPVAPVFPGSAVTPDNRSSIEFLCFSLDGRTLLGSIQDAPARFWDAGTGRFLGTADYFEDYRFYIARYGFTYTTAVITPDRKYLVTTKENHAEVWRLSFTPNPPQTP